MNFFELILHLLWFVLDDFFFHHSPVDPGQSRFEAVDPEAVVVVVSVDPRASKQFACPWKDKISYQIASNMYTDTFCVMQLKCTSDLILIMSHQN